MFLYNSNVNSNVFDFVITKILSSEEPYFLRIGTLNINICKDLITSTFRIFTDYQEVNSFSIQNFEDEDLLGSTLNENLLDIDLKFKSIMNPKIYEILNISETEDSIVYSLKLAHSGGYKIFYSLTGDDNLINSDGYINLVVLPNIYLGRPNQFINLKDIIMQTVISKLLGSLDKWISRILVSRSLSYNSIHFTPIQHISDSAYAIEDHTIPNKAFNLDPNKPCSFKDIQKTIEYIDKDLEMLCLSDVVLNHMVPDGPFLKTNPCCTYNLKNCPHLIPAYLLDQTLLLFSQEIENGIWESQDIPRIINCEEHLYGVRNELWQKIKELKLEEFFLIQISDELINQILDEIDILREQLRQDIDGILNFNDLNSFAGEPKVILIENFRSRNVTNINLKATANVLFKIHASQITREIISAFLSDLNGNIMQNLISNLDVAMDNIIASVRYRFVEPTGPRLGTVSIKNPLVERYFYVSPDIKFESIEAAERYSLHNAETCMLHNGWMNNQQNPLLDSAGAYCMAYLRREINPWTDTVKLYYGHSPSDNPQLWNYMSKYCLLTATIFKGVRLDNCHNTPLHVLKYFVGLMRGVRRDLLVVAELFTPSKKFDDLYISELGISFLSTDASAPHNSRHLAATLNKCCQATIRPNQKLLLAMHKEGNSTDEVCDAIYSMIDESKRWDSSIRHPLVQPITSNFYHSRYILFDQNHDNASIVEEQGCGWMVGVATLVSMVTGAFGSVRGCDELVPHRICVVEEKRLYKMMMMSESKEPTNQFVNMHCGMFQIRLLFNKMHIYLNNQSYTDCAATAHNNAILVERWQVSTNQIRAKEEEYFLLVVALSDSSASFQLKASRIAEILFEFDVECLKNDFSKDDWSINGLNGGDVKTYLKLKCRVDVEFNVSEYEDGINVEFKNNKIGTGYFMRCRLKDETIALLMEIEVNINSLLIHSTSQENELLECLLSLSKRDVDYILYGDNNYGLYHLPNYGDLKYCGFAGVYFAYLDMLANSNITCHPLYMNVVEGDWLMDYSCDRVEHCDWLRDVGSMMKAMCGQFKRLPKTLAIRYFFRYVEAIYLTLKN